MKNLEFMELNAQELENVDGGGFFDWIGEKLVQLWDWMVEHGNRDGNPGFTI